MPLFGGRKHTEASVEKILNNICLQAERMYPDADIAFYAIADTDGVSGVIRIDSFGSSKESAIIGTLKKLLQSSGAADVSSWGAHTVPRVGGMFK